MKRNCVCGSHCGIVLSAAKFRTAADMWCGKLVQGIVSQFSLQPYCLIIKSIDFCMYPVTCFKGFFFLICCGKPTVLVSLDVWPNGYITNPA